MYVGIHNWVGWSERTTTSDHILCPFLTISSILINFTRISRRHTDAEQQSISLSSSILFPSKSSANSDLSFELLTVIDPALSKAGWAYVRFGVFVAERSPRCSSDEVYGISSSCLYKVSWVISRIVMKKRVEIHRANLELDWLHSIRW